MKRAAALVEIGNWPRTSDKFKLKAQGPTPDMTMIQKLHIKVDANNNVTTQKDGQPVIKCK